MLRRHCRWHDVDGCQGGELAKTHGGDRIILYNKEKTVKGVLEVTHGVGVDAVFDDAGKSTYVSFCEVIMWTVP